MADTSPATGLPAATVIRSATSEVTAGDDCVLGEVDQQRTTAARELGHPSCRFAVPHSEIGHPSSGQRMRIGTNVVTIIVAGQQITEPLSVVRILEKLGEEASQGGDFCSGPHQSQLRAAVHDDTLASWPALGLISVEQLRISATGNNCGQLPAEVHRVLQAKVQAWPAQRRVDMRCVAHKEDPTRSVAPKRSSS